jgi:hypothetical protein
VKCCRSTAAQDIWELIKDCTASDPEKRPTAKVLPSHGLLPLPAP